MHYSSKTSSWALVTVSSDSLNYNWKGNALWQQFYCKAPKALIIKHLLAIFNHLKAINCVFNQSTCILEENLHLWMFVCYPWWSWNSWNKPNLISTTDSGWKWQTNTTIQLKGSWQSETSRLIDPVFLDPFLRTCFVVYRSPLPWL